ncbi:MAG: hypothetical protein ACFCVF_07770 [Kineosporiaceae bacterium]
MAMAKASIDEAEPGAGCLSLARVAVAEERTAGLVRLLDRLGSGR